MSAPPVRHESFLAHRQLRYGKAALALSLLVVIAYALHQPAAPPNGGTWLGYTLGGLGAALILFLLSFGLRKRSYASKLGSVKGWLSAHVYLGLALLLVATLHTGFQFGWNLHTLAYALMCVVICSGMYGVYLYWRFPALMSATRRQRSRVAMLATLAEQESRLQRTAAPLSPEIGEAVARVLARSEPRLLREELTSRLATAQGGDHAALQTLLEQAGEYQRLLDELHEYTRLQARLRHWLVLHVPLSFGLLAALIAHIVSVFLYW